MATIASFKKEVVEKEQDEKKMNSIEKLRCIVCSFQQLLHH
ncbi:hypothetical protein [Candidatus Phytoplasma pruni]|nr:hypothetical protein [Candidatus Phytoplasma pruni]